jgi:hypothetical protein
MIHEVAKPVKTQRLQRHCQPASLPERRYRSDRQCGRCTLPILVIGRRNMRLMRVLRHFWPVVGVLVGRKVLEMGHNHCLRRMSIPPHRSKTHHKRKETTKRCHAERKDRSFRPRHHASVSATVVSNGMLDCQPVAFLSRVVSAIGSHFSPGLCSMTARDESAARRSISSTSPLRRRTPEPML